MYKRKVICLTNKSYYGNCLDETSNVMEKSGNLWIMRDLKRNVPRPKTEEGKNTFKYRSALLWNLMPESVKKIKNHDKFKGTLIKYSKEIDSASYILKCFCAQSELGCLCIIIIHLYLIKKSSP